MGNINPWVNGRKNNMTDDAKDRKDTDFYDHSEDGSTCFCSERKKPKKDASLNYLAFILFFSCSVFAYCPENSSVASSLVDGYCLYTFTTNGTFFLGDEIDVEVLVVAGGGGGGSSFLSGGGGGGGIVFNTSYSASGNISVVVGAGGVVNVSGRNSSFGVLVAEGGGHGGAWSTAGTNGGSGGGGGGNNGGAAVGSQGLNGGFGSTASGGGGGGGGSNGSSDGASASGNAGGVGGSGSTYWGVVYACGGGGGANADSAVSGGCISAGKGGYSFGSHDYICTAAIANYGGGGGGGSNNYNSPGNGCNGGSGIVLVRFAELTTTTTTSTSFAATTTTLGCCAVNIKSSSGAAVQYATASVYNITSGVLYGTNQSDASGNVYWNMSCEDLNWSIVYPTSSYTSVLVNMSTQKEVHINDYVTARVQIMNTLGEYLEGQDASISAYDENGTLIHDFRTLCQSKPEIVCTGSVCNYVSVSDCEFSDSLGWYYFKAKVMEDDGFRYGRNYTLRIVANGKLADANFTTVLEKQPDTTKFEAFINQYGGIIVLGILAAGMGLVGIVVVVSFLSWAWHKGKKKR